MIDVVLIGHGNVGSHLARVFKNTEGIQLRQIFSTRKIENDAALEEIRTNRLSKISSKAAVYILAVPDDKISSISKKLLLKEKLVVHTSGSASIQVLSNKNRRGVFYPLQTFSKGTPVNFKEIPVCVEAHKIEDLLILLKLGNLISEKASKISSKERSEIHLAAVFINNFVNELYHISEDIMKKHTLDFDLLKPLIKETANKIQRLTPAQAQTGPAKRNDNKTIERHLEQLEDKSQKSIYTLLTESILKR
jgi:predicted short-subunit dehydrogenase-like oxidoreductase (DUF2520 family)